VAIAAAGDCAAMPKVRLLDQKSGSSHSSPCSACSFVRLLVHQPTRSSPGQLTHRMMTTADRSTTRRLARSRTHLMHSCTCSHLLVHSCTLMHSCTRSSTGLPLQCEFKMAIVVAVAGDCPAMPKVCCGPKVSSSHSDTVSQSQGGAPGGVTFRRTTPLQVAT